MIPAAEMAAMIAEAARSLDMTATLQRNTPTKDIWNNDVESWATVNAALPVRIATPNTPQMQRIAEQLGAVQAWLVSFALSADVRAGDRLVIGADTLRIHTLGTPQSYSTLNDAICTEVK